MPRKAKSISESKEKNGDIKVSVYDLSGKPSGTMMLKGEIFNVKVSPYLLSQAVRVYQANQRAGTHSTKTRGAVSGSTRKIYRQKGTGRARHGSIKAPIFIGGGIAHGPHPKNYTLSMPKEAKRKALFGALSQKREEGNLKVVKGLTEVKPKTKEIALFMKNISLNNDSKTDVLLVTSGNITSLTLAGRNYEGLSMTPALILNSYEVLVHKNILIMKEAVETMEKTFGKKEEKEEVKQDLKTKKAVKEEKTKRPASARSKSKGSGEVRKVTRKKPENNI